LSSILPILDSVSHSPHGMENALENVYIYFNKKGTTG